MRLSPEEIADLAHAELTLGADPDGWRRFWRRCIALSGSQPGIDPPAAATAAVGDDADEREGCDCWQCSPVGQFALNAGLARMLGPLSTDRPPVPVGVILEVSARTFGYTVEELRGNGLRRPMVMARHIAMYGVRQLTNLSYPAIGREFGGRDHSSVMHAVEKISRLMGERAEVFEQTTELLRRVLGTVS